MIVIYPTCSKSNTCKNAGIKCESCWSMSSVYNVYPDYKEKKPSKIQSKIFKGTASMSADYNMNIWLDGHPEARIIDMRFAICKEYQAICILYEEA